MLVHEKRTNDRKVHKLSSVHALITECGLRPLVVREGVKRKDPLKVTHKWSEEVTCDQCNRTRP